MLLCFCVGCLCGLDRAALGWRSRVVVALARDGEDACVWMRATLPRVFCRAVLCALVTPSCVLIGGGSSLTDWLTDRQAALSCTIDAHGCAHCCCGACVASRCACCALCCALLRGRYVCAACTWRDRGCGAAAVPRCCLPADCRCCVHLRVCLLLSVCVLIGGRCFRCRAARARHNLGGNETSRVRARQQAGCHTTHHPCHTPPMGLRLSTARIRPVIRRYLCFCVRRRLCAGLVTCMCAFLPA